MSSAPSPPPAPSGNPQREPGGSPAPDDPQNEPSGKLGAAGDAARKPLGMALLALCSAGAAMLMTSGPLWMTVAGVVCGVAAMVFAVVALIRIRTANRRPLILFSTLVAVAVAGFALLSGGVRLAFWDTVSAYEQCTTQSVTISGEAACQETMEEDLRGLLLPGLS